MANISHRVTGSQNKIEKPALHASTPFFSNNALTDKSAASINGCRYYRQNLEDIKSYSRLLYAGGYINAKAESIEAAYDNAQSTMQSLKDKYDECEIKVSRRFGCDILYCADDLNTLDGCWWHEYKDVFLHPPTTKEALISGLYLLHKQGFLTTTERHEWDYFSEEEERLEYYSEDDETQMEYLECVKFYKTEPIHLKFYSRSFHHHASKRTPLGDWLRCCWHYRNFRWADLIADIQYDDGTPLSPFDGMMICYDWNDFFSREIRYGLDAEYGEYGEVGFADYRAVSENGIIREHQYTPEQRRQLETDFNKMWAFNLGELDYQKLMDSNRKPLPELPIYKLNHYDYRKRKLSTRADINRVRRTNYKKDLRRAKQNTRWRTACKQPAYNRRCCFVR